MSWLGPTLSAFAYLLGSVSFAILVARRYGVDPRSEGSHNPGATNVGRLVGKRAGRMVLALDAAKGALPMLAARGLLGMDDVWSAVVGSAAVLGHCFPIWHGGRGGKGAATAAGVMLVAAPPAGLAAVLTYLVAKKVTRRASVGSLAGALVGAIVSALWAGWDTPAAAAGVVIFVLVVLRHADNIVRLARGEEPES